MWCRRGYKLRQECTDFDASSGLLSFSDPQVGVWDPPGRVLDVIGAGLRITSLAKELPGRIRGLPNRGPRAHGQTREFPDCTCTPTVLPSLQFRLWEVESLKHQLAMERRRHAMQVQATEEPFSWPPTSGDARGLHKWGFPHPEHFPDNQQVVPTPRNNYLLQGGCYPL